MSVMDELIVDRTPEDVAQAAYLATLWGPSGWAGTAGELAQWTAGLRGSYNVTDLNRVGRAVDYVAQRLNAAGYLVSVSPKTDWSELYYPTPAQLVGCMADVDMLWGVLVLHNAVPHTPTDCQRLTYQEANAIERILLEVDRALTNSQKSVDLGWCLGLAHLGLYGGV